ncbi:MAG: hypothetical protein GF311_06200 [Candidatus Lokiarchaeota archaeon]|nr:hypothetical protein [Candidatus Lokiarchaeota archaeon]
MGKKNKSKLGIKTSRYFTKKCSSCGYEYPNWFVSCPKCGASWDEAIGTDESSIKKNVKIVAKMTEEDFDKPIKHVNLVFSGDQGQSWYKMSMEFKSDYYVAEIMEVPEGARIIYYIEVELIDDEKIIENNEGRYFIYRVGSVDREKAEPASKEQKIPSSEPAQKSITSTPTSPKEYFQPDTPESPEHDQTPPVDFSKGATEYMENSKNSSQKSPTFTIFGEPQTEKETDLKLCPGCNSQIKSLWSVCPICGHKF